MPVSEFRRLGYLQEINRGFLHPLGLALEVVREEDGAERFGEVWDLREDPEGIIFSEAEIDSDETREKARYVDARWRERTQARGSLGYVIQPIPDSEES